MLPLIGSHTAQQMGLIKIQYENIERPKSDGKQTSAHRANVNKKSSANDNEYNAHVVSTHRESENANGKTVAPDVNGSVTKAQVFSKYSDVFDGLGEMPGEVHLHADPDVKPVINPPRKVPIALKPKLKDELNRLETMGVLRKVTESTDWVSSLLTVVKPSGKLRLCIDPQHLNSALKREHYPLPVIEDILPQLANVKVFSLADCKEGFFQCKLDNESSLLTTFQTPWGRYRWMRMPFGISPAPEIFQQRLDQNLEGLKGIFKIADDILITGSGATEVEAEIDHDRNLLKLLQRCRERNIKLNSDKFKFKCKELKFIGHMLTSRGLQPDPAKVEAVCEMKPPVDVAGIQRFVGMTKYLAKFLPDLSELSEPLRRLTHKDVEWSWTEEQTQAFENIKEAVTSAPVLKYFDPKADTEGQGDASEHGLGFVLMQDGQPVSYASRALTPPETRYSQLEKELLAQVFGLERNHHYVYGRKIKLWTDHKPLVNITRKPMTAAPKRLQNLLLRLSHYDVEIFYKPGKEMYLADTLSRAYLKNSSRSKVAEEIESIHMIDSVPEQISDKTLSIIKTATAEDHALQIVQHYIANGWPEHRHRVAPEARPYYNVSDELSFQDGLIFRGTRVVIPNAARQRIRERLHSAHMGVHSTLRRARDCVYWPAMSDDLKDYLANCEACNTYQTHQQKEPLINHKLPDRPWEKIGIDLFAVEGKDYLCTVDYFSDFFEIDHLPHTKDANVIIKRLKHHFSAHGVPDLVFSDNGPPFNSQDFADFAAEYEFDHKTSSPEYPQSNGKAESAVKIAKGIIVKNKKSKGDLDLALLEWRNTPTEGLGSSPAQRLFGRRTKTLLPTTRKLLKPKIQTRIKKKKQHKQDVQKHQYDRHAKSLAPLKTGETVRMKPKHSCTDKRWTKAKVQEQVDIRSYSVITEDGREYRRNRKHLKSTKEAFTPHKDAKNTDGAEQARATQDTNAEANNKQRWDPGDIRKKGTSTGDEKQQSSQPEQTEQTIVVRRSSRQKTQPKYLQDYVEY